MVKQNPHIFVCNLLPSFISSKKLLRELCQKNKNTPCFIEKKKKDKSVIPPKKSLKTFYQKFSSKHNASMKPKLDSSTDSQDFFQNESASRFMLMASYLLGLGLPPGQQFSSV